MLCDSSQAFDCDSHEILLSKLGGYELGKHTLDVTSYFGRQESY